MINLETTLKKSDLIDALKKNRDAHVVDYERARAVFLVDVKKKLKSLLKKANTGEVTTYNVGLSPPVLRKDKYDQIIGQLEMSQETELKIDTKDYNCIVNDDWDWVASAKMLNSTYSSRWSD